MRKWGLLWIDNLNEASTTIATMFARKVAGNLDGAFRAILKQAGFTVQFKPTRGMVQAYRATVASQVNLIRSIAPQFLTDVQSSVWASVMQGADMHTLSTGLRRVYGVTWRRAALIARDQNAKAKAIMEEQRRSELGITEAIWHHSHAGKEPRPTHVAMHGKRYQIKLGMFDTDVNKYVWPGTEINCRCTSSAIIPGID
jgi:SPP1 gp7 family putative phage head morphogenesis protein